MSSLGEALRSSDCGSQGAGPVCGSEIKGCVNTKRTWPTLPQEQARSSINPRVIILSTCLWSTYVTISTSLGFDPTPLGPWVTSMCMVVGLGWVGESGWWGLGLKGACMGVRALVRGSGLVNFHTQQRGWHMFHIYLKTAYLNNFKIIPGGVYLSMQHKNDEICPILTLRH